jgi:hypothetical protein
VFERHFASFARLLLSVFAFGILHAFMSVCVYTASVYSAPEGARTSEKVCVRACVRLSDCVFVCVCAYARGPTGL